MNLDDGGRFVAESSEFLAERAARSTMSPEYVRRGFGQKITMEMPRSTGGESVERITGILARQTVWAIAPAEQSRCHRSYPRAVA